MQFYPNSLRSNLTQVPSYKPYYPGFFSIISRQQSTTLRPRPIKHDRFHLSLVGRDAACTRLDMQFTSASSRQRCFLTRIRTTEVPKNRQRRLTSRIRTTEAPKNSTSLNKYQPSLAESSSTTGIQALSKESLMRLTLLRMAYLSPSPVISLQMASISPFSTS